MRSPDLLLPSGVPVYKDPDLPLTRKNPLTGETEDALCYSFNSVYGDRILVHPDRWDAFLAEMAKVRP